jgi:polyisoprenyl-phosphate glycosyltransferase
MTELSVVIPIYNEEENIPSLVSRLRTVLERLGVSYEMIFINDGSRDNSVHLIRMLAAQDARVKYIDFSRNFGHQVAVTAGIDAARGASLVIIDADLQDPPELIIDLHHKLREGYNVVYAKRKSRQGENFFKRFTAKLFYRTLSRITNIDIPLDTGDFRIIDRKVIDVLKKMPEQQKFLRGQIAWIGFRQTFVEYDRHERNAGTTGYTLKKMLRLALDGVTSFSNFPLKFATAAGFLVSGFSFILMLYALYSRFISKNYEPGWTSLMLVILFIGGIQLIGIGIIGEYLSRVSANVRGRPLYIISESNVQEQPAGEKQTLVNG